MSKLLSPKEAEANLERVKALTAKHGVNAPYIGIAALGALCPSVSSETLEEALLAAEMSVFLADKAGKIRLAKDSE